MWERKRAGGEAHSGRRKIPSPADPALLYFQGYQDGNLVLGKEWEMSEKSSPAHSSSVQGTAGLQSGSLRNVTSICFLLVSTAYP